MTTPMTYLHPHLPPQPLYTCYVTCPYCQWQHIPSIPDDLRCNLCRVSQSVKKTAEREEQKRKTFAPRTCQQCGDMFKSRSANSKYCTKACRLTAEQEGRKQHFINTCPQCGVEFETTDSRRIVCSTRCRHRRKYEQERERNRLAEMMAESERKRREQSAA